jgi:hypothetical protein
MERQKLIANLELVKTLITNVQGHLEDNKIPEASGDCSQAKLHLEIVDDTLAKMNKELQK